MTKENLLWLQLFCLVRVGLAVVDGKGKFTTSKAVFLQTFSCIF